MGYEMLTWKAWAANATRDEVAEKLALQQDEIVRLRDAVKVLAASEAKHAATNRDIHGVQSDSILDYCDEDVFYNPIAAAAVREAGR